MNVKPYIDMTRDTWSKMKSHNTKHKKKNVPTKILFSFSRFQIILKNILCLIPYENETGNKGPTCGTEIEAHVNYISIFLALCICCISSTWDTYFLVGTIYPPLCVDFFTSSPTFSSLSFLLSTLLQKKKF